MIPFRSRIAFFCLMTSLLVVPAAASAQLTPGNTGLQAAAQGSGLTGGCNSANCIAEVIGRAINIVLGFLGIVLLCLFLYAGFLWMTAGGDEGKVKTARQLITNAIIGYFIIGAAYALTGFVLDSLVRVTSPAEEAGPAEEAPAEGGGGGS
jgi:predicted permease